MELDNFPFYLYALFWGIPIFLFIFFYLRGKVVCLRMGPVTLSQTILEAFI